MRRQAAHIYARRVELSENPQAAANLAFETRQHSCALGGKSVCNCVRANTRVAHVHFVCNSQFMEEWFFWHTDVL